MVAVKRGLFLECGGNTAALALSLTDIVKNGYVQTKAPPLAAYSSTNGLRCNVRGDMDQASV